MAEKIKLLFLDIDGVLNNATSSTYWERKDKDGFYNFCPINTTNLFMIVEETGCKIVISSSWRIRAKNLDEMKGWFKGWPLIQDAIISSTPMFRLNCKRGAEIIEWFKKTKNLDLFLDSHFAVVDDDSDMDGIPDQHFFQTDGYHGLLYRDARKIIEFLNRKK